MIVKKKNHFLNRFLLLIEENHQSITDLFMNDLLHNNDTAAYRSMDKFIIYESSNIIYRNLSKWTSQNFSKENIKSKYVALGKDRWKRGIPFPQVQKAMVLQKRHLWLYVMNQIKDEVFDYMEAIDLNNQVALYFDRAVFYMLKGYDEKINKKF